MTTTTHRTFTGATEKPRKPRGGRRPYVKGANAERRAKRALEAVGWFVHRSPKSASPIDLLCVRHGGSVYSRVEWVQMKSKGYLAPAERVAVLELADEFGGVPVLGWIEKNTLYRRNLDTGESLADVPCPR